MPAQFVLTLGGGVELSFQEIPPGDFVMGSRAYNPPEEPLHRVRIAHASETGVERPFYLGTTPVTQAQFEAWTRVATPPDGTHENGFPGRPEHPAESLSWRDAMEYCVWLTHACADQLLTGYIATLPTEAEWEYACKAGTETEYWHGDGDAALRAIGWFDVNSGGETREVGLRPPNPFGLRDMHGNVDEWCWDEWDSDVYKLRGDGVPDPGSSDRSAWVHARTREELDANPQDRNRVLRGGSWNISARFCRSAFRNWRRPWDRFWCQGFRVCLVPGPVTTART